MYSFNNNSSLLASYPNYYNKTHTYNQRLIINDCCVGSGSNLNKLLANLTNNSNLNMDRELDWGDSSLRFFSVSNGDKYVLKQIKDAAPDEQFLLVLDSVGSGIAEEMGFPTNRVRIIPAYTNSNFKKYPNLPATVHTFVRGIRTDEDHTYYPGIDIQQRFRLKGTPMYQKYGPLSPEDTGLSRSVIRNMSKHPDLATIVAFDTFLGNADRSKPNLFYCPECDRFVGIDQASVFRFNLASEAFRQIRTLSEKRVKLSFEEVRALKRYRDTLLKLYTNYPLDRLEQILDKEVRIAGFYDGSPLYNEGVAQRLRFHKRNARETIEVMPQLLNALDILIKENS